MQTMQLLSPAPIEEHPLALSELDIPEPGAGQLRLRIRACGVCHTDLHTVEGELELPRLPIVPGHQIVGVVDGLGRGVQRFHQGDRIGVGWLNSSCGACQFCLTGRENLCRDARFTGLHVDGGYAQYAVVDEDSAYRLPEDLTDIEAAPLLCAGIIGYRSLRLSGIRPGGRLGLYGFGASAHLAIQVARHWQCDVYVFSRGEHHRRLARDLGAAWTGGVQDTPPVPLDSSVIFAPAGWMVPLALKHLAPGGILAINAIYMSPIPEFAYDLIYLERTVRSVANYTRQDAEEFLSLAAEIPVRTETEVYALGEANQVLQRLKQRQIQGSAVLSIPHLG